jgi:hypothetical protein
MNLILGKIKKFWEEHEFKVILAVGIILVAGVSFESGYLKGKSVISPIFIEKPGLAQNLSPDNTQVSPLKDQNSVQEVKTEITGSNMPPKNCVYVGSKNSNKYHLPTCQWAKNIKPENLVCFSSAEDAQTKGYQAGCVK